MQECMSRRQIGEQIPQAKLYRGIKKEVKDNCFDSVEALQRTFETEHSSIQPKANVNIWLQKHHADSHIM